eukprot:gene422-587_t
MGRPENCGGETFGSALLPKHWRRLADVCKALNRTLPPDLPFTCKAFGAMLKSSSGASTIKIKQT